MLISKENREIRDRILSFDRRIEEMHIKFQGYRTGDETKMPEWEALEREIVLFSRRKMFDLELRNHLDRVMHKIQNRKKIWLRWAEEYQQTPRRKEPREP